MRYAIVGFGTAGYHAVEAIRETDTEGVIDVYGDTGLAPYNPMLTTYYACGKVDKSGMFPFGSLEQIQKTFGFNYRKQRVVKVHAAEHTVETEESTEAYDKILIATGATAFAPPIKGLEKEDAFVMRSVFDAERLKQRLEQGNVKTAIVVGASMAGIKVVEVLTKFGVKVVLADLAKHIFPLAAYPEGSEIIENRVASAGVDQRYGVSIDHIEVKDGVKTAVMTDGSEVATDLVALCIGTRAATAVVQGEVQINRGITVNSHMETSVSGIYAAGDCCEGGNLQSGQNMIIGLWANANHQGRTAGINMAGGDAEFEGNILHNITHFMDMDFIGFGDNRISGRLLEMGNPNQGLYIRVIIADGKIAGANILDSYRISGIVKNYMLRLFAGDREKLPNYQLAKLKLAGVTKEFIEELEGALNG